MLDQQQKDSYKETPEPAFAGTGVSLSTDLFYSPHIFLDKFTKNWLTGRDRYAIVKNAILWQDMPTMLMKQSGLML